ncbi:hypothetical protein GQ54DRAFT_331859 [Martensiomyces pterosporus]|nr:hypothetical protein GQ54DRAFT_331859 [Martensiomyces pterosporus]
MIQHAPAQPALRRTPSVLSHISEANTIVEPSSHGVSLVHGAPGARQAATARRYRRTFMILIKAFAQDRAEIKAHMEEEERATRASSPVADSTTNHQPLQPHTLNRISSSSSSGSSTSSSNTSANDRASASSNRPSQDEPSAAASSQNPNDYLINWTLKTYNIDPRNDMIILVNVRSLAASTKTKWYDSSIAAYAQLYDAEERAKSIKLLQKYLNSLWSRGYQCRALALLGDKREEIASRAMEEHVNSIVVGQRRKQKGLMMGMRNSFISSLVLSSETPVSVVKLPQ